ncbi:RNA polymerase sigma-70 factor [Mucilaginibacter sp. UR6-11]|uniref:RNA polymerase sigma-70 factor n=1 Tax=Mucilaginibacter sp. UR6-11 TaxID=1435644 RepID=UPI001E5E1C3F|nr:RNA polymerase sigma-70 factor [Mucilaginibacter sp. UR6-11]MCC8423710.1 RNA polymerase sigma-70 factor [Mucilaginibacter sp. UR6-11]
MELFKKLSDEKLVALIAENNNKAFRALYNRYWDKMLVKAYTLLQSHDLAEEVVQDAFINFWKRRHTIELKYSFHTYIASVVKYEVMTKIAGRNKQPLYIDDVTFANPADHSTQQWLDFDELKNQIETTIHTLPDKCQLVFKLSREEGLTARQISDTLNISHKTVEAHITKAIKVLRVSLSSFFI